MQNTEWDQPDFEELQRKEDRGDEEAGRICRRRQCGGDAVVFSAVGSFAMAGSRATYSGPGTFFKMPRTENGTRVGGKWTAREETSKTTGNVKRGGEDGSDEKRGERGGGGGGGEARRDKVKVRVVSRRRDGWMVERKRERGREEE